MIDEVRLWFFNRPTTRWASSLVYLLRLSILTENFLLFNCHVMIIYISSEIMMTLSKMIHATVSIFLNGATRMFKKHNAYRIYFVLRHNKKGWKINCNISLKRIDGRDIFVVVVFLFLERSWLLLKKKVIGLSKEAERPQLFFFKEGKFSWLRNSNFCKRKAHWPLFFFFFCFVDAFCIL